MYWNEKTIEALDLKALQEQLNKLKNSKDQYIYCFIKKLFYFNNLIN